MQSDAEEIISDHSGDWMDRCGTPTSPFDQRRRSDMKAFVSAETIADAVACLREAGTPLPATVAGLDDVALGRALWRMNADALTVNHDDVIEGYAAPAASDSAAQRVKSLTHLVQQCCVAGALKQELFLTLFKSIWTATCKIAGADEGVLEVTVPAGEDWDAATWGRNEPTGRF